MSINFSNKVNERLIGQAIVSEAHTIGITAVATVTPGLIRLVEVPQAPSPLSTVSIPGYTEITVGSPTGTQFLVDYLTGVISFNVSQDGNAILVSYIGLGSEIAAEDINELQGPVGVALNLNGSLSNNIVKPASISNTGTDDFIFPRDVTANSNLIATTKTTTDLVKSRTGNLLLEPLSNSIIGIKLANASGTAILDVDTTNSRVGINNVAPTTDLDVTGEIKATDFTTATASPAGTGVVRLAHSNSVVWRDNAGTGDSALATDASDNLTWKGSVIATGSGAVTSVQGTANEVLVNGTSGSAQVGALTLTTPQAIGTASTPTFASETLAATTNQLILGVTNTTTITSPAPSASRIVTLPDVGINSSFILSEGVQTVNGTIVGHNDNATSLRVAGPDFFANPVQSYSGIFYDASYTDNGSLKTRFITGGNEGMDVELQSTADILISAVGNGSYITGILKLNSSTNVVVNARTTSDTLSVKQLLIDRVDTVTQGTGNTSDVNLNVNSGNLALLYGNTTGAVYVNSLSTTQRDALTKVVGMIIWNITTSTLESWNGSTWDDLPGSAVTGANYTLSNLADTVAINKNLNNFSAGTITASLTGAASLNLLLTGGTMTGVLTPPHSTNAGVTGTVTPVTGATEYFYTIIGITTLNGPATPTADGQKVTFRLLQDNTGYAVTFATGAGNFRYGTDITSFTASAANKTDYVGAIYNSAADRWDIISVIQGF